MATKNTWFYQSSQDLNSSITLYGLLNGGSRYLRVRRVGVLNIGTGGSETVPRLVTLYRYRATITWTPGTAGTAKKMDSANSALDTVTVGSGGTPTTTGSADILRCIAWSGMKFARGQLVCQGSWEAQPPMSMIWDSGYWEPDCQPLVINPGQGMFIIASSVALYGSTTVGAWAEFTDEAS